MLQNLDFMPATETAVHETTVALQPSGWAALPALVLQNVLTFLPKTHLPALREVRVLLLTTCVGHLRLCTHSLKCSCTRHMPACLPV